MRTNSILILKLSTNQCTTKLPFLHRYNDGSEVRAQYDDTFGSFIIYIFYFQLEFEAEVSPDLAIQGNKQAEKYTYILIDFFALRYCSLSLIGTCTSIFVLSIIQHGSDFEQYLYLPNGF